MPVTHVTNGVHTPTWDSAAADRLWEVTCGKDRWREATDEFGKGLSHASAIPIFGSFGPMAANLWSITCANCTSGR